MDNDIFYRKLVRRFRDGLATEEELLLLSALMQSEELEGFFAALMDDELRAVKSMENRRNMVGWLRYAAALILVVGCAVLYWHRSARLKLEAMVDVPPAHNQAVLRLADGKTVHLDTINGVLQVDLGKIRDQQGKTLYEGASHAVNSYHTVQVPKGGRFEMRLDDGTTVMLNAASELVFPTRFAREKREVFLTGEGFFQVRKQADDRDKMLPFIVHTAAQLIEVVGTSFNVQAYQDANTERTTLLEGTVRAQALKTGETKTLHPGQQVSLEGGQVSLSSADMEETLAWKEGAFVFNETPIREIVEQLARWYNVEIYFEGNTNYRYNGYIDRQANLSEVLKTLKRTGDLDYRLKEGKITLLHGSPADDT
ncbi:FecR family protein [Sphingobacterium griseoflavum]|uniref:Anti-sigma factor n=1 Tax=Sphingobacterium griseoflavum TaxID=1474952 RepID=A0ABQ3HWP3_9SPHI|nr:FecR family protein [Sphingobacterium griseoflavum]GHE28544.1 hypothetical protein GCM10017764_08750 [Sphingobacterium griseoflavum]